MGRSRGRLLAVTIVLGSLVGTAVSVETITGFTKLAPAVPDGCGTWRISVGTSVHGEAVVQSDTA